MPRSSPVHVVVDARYDFAHGVFGRLVCKRAVRTVYDER